MRKRLLAGVTVLTIGSMSLATMAAVVTMVAPAAAQSGSGGSAAAKKHYGSWSGTWEGGGQSGGFDITLEAGKDGTPGGHVSVTGEPTYKATLKTLSFDGAKMTATYDFPPDPTIVVTLTATFDADAAKGAWSIKGGNVDGMSGTWTVKKK